MTNTQHTPGPWQIGDGGFTVFGPTSPGVFPVTIAPTKSRANARLIAAAPELLAALLNTTDALDQLMREGTLKIGHPYAPHVRDLIANARAAIAKATGQ